MSTDGAKPLRVLFVEDDPRFFAELRDLVAARADLVLVGSYRAAEPAIAAIAAGLEVDVAIVDLGLPRMAGPDVIRRLKGLGRSLEVLVLTALADDDSLFGALRAGASGYLLKGGTAEELARAVREVHAGGAPMSPGVARRVLRELQAGGVPEGAALTARETEVLQLLARGTTYAEAATMLAISLSTVQFHVRALYRKLEVSTKAEATAEAFRRGLVR